MPDYLNLRRLEGRIVALFLALLLVVQFASFGLIRSSIARNADASIATELKTGERIFLRLLSQRADKLHDAAELLAKDYGFIDAVGLPLAEQGTVETIKDALANQGDRIGANLVAYFDIELKLVAATRDEAALISQLQTELKPGAKPGVETARLALLGGQVYQLAWAPVKTPAQVGWILMGFALESTVLQDLQQLSELQAVVVRQDQPGHWLRLLSLLPAEMAQDPDRLARFRREAQLLAALNHPNVAAIHGLDEAGGQLFLDGRSPPCSHCGTPSVTVSDTFAWLYFGRELRYF